MNPNLAFLKIVQEATCKCTISTCHTHKIEAEDVTHLIYCPFDSDGHYLKNEDGDRIYIR